MIRLFITLFFLLISVNSSAQSWKIVPEESHVHFTGRYVGEGFKGIFPKWDADINFDLAHLENSQINVSIDLSAVETNNSTYTKTLAEGDWFNSKKVQFAKFISTKIYKKEGDVFDIKGELEIKGVKKIIEFDANIKFIGNSSYVIAEFDLDRLNWDIGRISDSNGAWVDKDIKIFIKIVALKN